MKKVFVLLVIIFTPFLVFGKEYEIKSINLKMHFDDNFIVITRDNLNGNEDLKNLNITEEYMQNFFNNNYAYVDAIPESKTYELILRVLDGTTEVNNLKNYSNKELESLGEAVAKKLGADDYNIYNNKYNYIVVEYTSGSYNILTYYTVVNHRGYTFQIQKNTGIITANERMEFKNVIDQLEFNITEIGEKNIKQEGFNWKRVIVGGITGAIIGGFSGFLGLMLKKKKNRAS